VSFTLDRYDHLYPEADTALRDRLDALYGSARPAPSRGCLGGPAVASVPSGNDKGAADGTLATL
jgi:hypothetical protein